MLREALVRGCLHDFGSRKSWAPAKIYPELSLYSLISVISLLISFPMLLSPKYCEADLANPDYTGDAESTLNPLAGIRKAISIKVHQWSTHSYLNLLSILPPSHDAYSL